MDRKKVLLQAIESGFEVTSEGIPCETEYAKGGYALDYVIEGNDGGVGDLTGNLFNYAEPTGQIQADQDGWFDITIDNSTGTSTKYANCRTKVNSALKTGTSYYVYYEVAEKSGDLNVWVTEGSPVKGDSGQFTSSCGNKSGFNTTRDSFDECKSMTRTTVTCAAGKSGHIKFRIGVYETKQDQFMYNQYKIPLVNHENGNLFNYTEPKNDNQVKADKDGWFDITIDNSTGTSTVYKNCWTNINPVLKPDTRYYLYTEIAEQSGDIVYAPCTTTTNSISQFKWGLNTPTGYITTISDFTSAAYMLRTYCACTAGKSGHIKFRIAVYETKQDTFTPYVIPQTTEILLDAPLMSGESIRYTSDNLPALPLQENVNTITVGTTVQPTNLTVKYRAKVR